MTRKPHKLSYMPPEHEQPWTVGAWAFVVLCVLQLCTLGYVIAVAAGLTLFGH